MSASAIIPFCGNTNIIYELEDKMCCISKLKIDRTFDQYLKPQSDIHCNRFGTSPRPKFITIAEVAEESQLGLQLVGDWSATDRGLVGDFAGTCLRPNQSQPSFCPSTKTWLRLIWSQRGPRSVADFSATSLGPIGDLVATSAIGENCQSRRGRRAVAVYV